jgi:acyl carrier protein
VLSVPHVEKALEVLGENRLVNGYGPTENTTFTCCHTVTASRGQCPSVPIGRPIANTQVYVLDSKQQLVPAGVPGELYTGGYGLARGYLNRADLTAEKFVPNPFSSQPGARLYKTGDVVRHLPDGNIEFLGRKDQQLKVRGFRIEPGEIEAALVRHAAVRDAVITGHEDESGDKYLVAYVMAEAEAAVDSHALRDFLKEKLPEYMMPSTFVMTDTLPLTANGKLDRQALPVPVRARAEGGGVFVGPRTPSEKLIAEIWSAVLNLDQVGVHDNFFDLGGHSLKATRVVSRVREVFRVELPVCALFQSPTIAALSETIEIAQRSGTRPEAPAIVPVSRELRRAKIYS